MKTQNRNCSCGERGTQSGKLSLYFENDEGEMMRASRPVCSCETGQGGWQDDGYKVLVLHFNNSPDDLRAAAKADPNIMSEFSCFYWEYREDAQPGEPPLDMFIPLKRRVTLEEYPRLAQLVAQRLGPCLDPVLRLPGASKSGFVGASPAGRWALDPDIYLTSTAR